MEGQPRSSHFQVGVLRRTFIQALVHRSTPLIEVSRNILGSESPAEQDQGMEAGEGGGRSLDPPPPQVLLS